MSEQRSVSTVKYAVSVRCSRTVALSIAPVSPIPPIVAQNSCSVSPAGRQRAHLAVGHQQVEGLHVVAEAALGVMVLAVHVGGDRPTDGHLPGARQHRDPEAERQQRPHQRIQADPGLDGHRGWFGAGVDGEDLVQLGQVEGDPAGVLGGVAVAAAQSPRHHAAVVGRAQRGDGVGDRFDLGQMGHAARGPAPAVQLDQRLRNHRLLFHHRRVGWRGLPARSCEHRHGDDHQPQRANPLQDPIVQHDLLWFARVAGVDLEGILQQAQRKRSDRDRASRGGQRRLPARGPRTPTGCRRSTPSPRPTSRQSGDTTRSSGSASGGSRPPRRWPSSPSSACRPP